MNHLETAKDEVVRHLKAGKRPLLEPSEGWQQSGWKAAHEAAAKYLKLKPTKVTRK